MKGTDGRPPTDGASGKRGRIRKLELLGLVCLVLLSFAPRLQYLLELREEERVSCPTLDAAENLSWARAQATGDWSERGELPRRLQALKRSPFINAPGYPWFLAGWLKLSGMRLFGFLLLQQGMGVVTIILLWWLARRWVGPCAAWLAAAIAATHWPSVYYAGEFLDSTLLALLIALLLAFAANLASRPDANAEGGGKGSAGALAQAFFSGVLIGLIIITRPAAKHILPVYLVWFLWVMWRRENPSLRTTALALMRANLPVERDIDEDSDILLESLRSGRMVRLRAAFWVLPKAFRKAGRLWAGVLLGALLVVAPVLVRNARMGGLGAPIATGAAVSSLVAALPEYAGADDGDLGTGHRLDRVCDYGQLAEVSGSVRARDITRHFRSRKRALFAAQPEGVGGSFARRALLFAGPLEVGSSRVVEYDRQASGSLRRLPASFAILLSLAVLGVAQWLRLRRERPSEDESVSQRVVAFAMPLLAGGIMLAWTFGHIAQLASGHLRQPLAPCLVFLGAWAFKDLCDSVFSRNIKESVLWWVTLLCLLIAASQNIAGYVPNRSKWLLDRGLALEGRGRHEAALVAYRTVLMATPQALDPESGVRLADSSVTGPADVKRFRQAGAVACMKLGNAAVLRGERSLALAYFEQAEEMDPRRSEALVNAGVILVDMQRFERAARVLALAIERDPRALPAYYPLAKALYRLGRYRESAELLERLLAMKPEHKPAHRLRALMPD